jgi:hypothetical protein
MIGNASLRACRIAFLAASLVPTLAGIAGLVWHARSHQTPPSAEAWPGTIELLLGSAALVERVENQGPGHATLVGVTLVDPTTSAPRARLSQLTVRQGATAWELSTDLLILHAEHLATAAEACLVLPHATGTGRIPSPGDWTLTADRVLLQAGPLQQTFQQAVISVSRKTTGRPEAKLTVAAYAADQRPDGRPLSLEWVQTLSEAGVRSAGQFTTGAASVACRAAATLWPPVARLGTACEFRGEWSWSHVGQDRQVALRGELVDVDLDALISEQFPHRLSGKARVQIDEAVVQQGRLSELRGTIEAEGGVLSASLLAAAAEHLQLAAPRNLLESPPTAAIGFQRLQAAFALDGSRLTLQGNADGHSPGVILAGRDDALLTASANHGVAAVALVRMLVPAADYQVPATRQTAMLVRLLPVPEASPSVGLATRHTPTRLAPASAVDATATPPLRPPGLR